MQRVILKILPTKIQLLLVKGILKSYSDPIVTLEGHKIRVMKELKYLGLLLKTRSNLTIVEDW